MKIHQLIARSMATMGFASITAFMAPAQAAEGDIGPVLLDSVGVLEVAGGGHLAGNMEIKIRGGFTVPSGLTCDNNYITTLKSTDSSRRIGRSPIVVLYTSTSPLASAMLVRSRLTSSV